MEDENELLRKISKPLPILYIFFTSVLYLLIYSSLEQKKILSFNLDSKKLNYTK
jgi:hypothetical protein